MVSEALVFSNQGCKAVLNLRKIVALVPKLPEAQRVVLELYFGLNGAKPCGSTRIATKLARTRYWVDARLNAGLQESAR